MTKSLMGAGTHYNTGTTGGTTSIIRALTDCYTPKGTSTWSPLNHGTYMDIVDEAVEKAGYQLKDTEAIVDDGHYFMKSAFGTKAFAGRTIEGKQRIEVPEARLFGTAELVPKNYDLRDALEKSGYKPMLGLRSANDKRFSAMVMLGNQVHICSNLCWSAEIFETRRHVGDVVSATRIMVDKAFQELDSKVREQHDRIEAYKHVGFFNSTFNTLLEDTIYRRKVMSATKYKKALDCWYEPEHEEFRPRTLYSAWNALTSAQGLKRDTRSQGSTLAAMGIQQACDAYVS